MCVSLPPLALEVVTGAKESGDAPVAPQTHARAGGSTCFSEVGIVLLFEPEGAHGDH